MYTTIRPKVRVLINLFSLFVHDHWTKIRCHFYSEIYYFLNWTNIFFAVVPLCFVCYSHTLIFRNYIHTGAALIFRTLYRWLYGVVALKIPWELIFHRKLIIYWPCATDYTDLFVNIIARSFLLHWRVKRNTNRKP